VEFVSEQAAKEFCPPPWFGREVTDVDGWSNAELARRGRPDL
jgi:CYTH domain-containing protein